MSRHQMSQTSLFIWNIVMIVQIRVYHRIKSIKHEVICPFKTPSPYLLKCYFNILFLILIIHQNQVIIENMPLINI